MPLNTATTENHCTRPLVIPVFIPNAGCPHRCIFCNQEAVTGQAAQLPTAAMLRARIDHFFSHRIRRRHPVEIAFFGGNFLGLDAGTVDELLGAASRYVDAGRVDGLRFSTRPDTLNQRRIDLLRAYPVTTVEIGAQSMVDTVLACSKRGHNAADTARALKLLKKAGYKTGLQLMVGLPAESRGDLETTGRAVVSLAPDFVRIYPTLVLAESPLAVWYRQQRFSPLDLKEAVWRTKTLFRLFHAAGIRVIRMGLQASADLDEPGQVLAGPYHPAFGHLVFSALFLDAATATIAAAGHADRHLELRVNPRSESKLRGMHNRNLDLLKHRFGCTAVGIVVDDRLSEQELGFNDLKIDILATTEPVSHQVRNR